MRIFLIGFSRGIPAIGAIFFSLFVAEHLSLASADVFFLWFAVLYGLSFVTRLGFDVLLLKEIASDVVKSASRYKKVVFIVSVLFSIGLSFVMPREVFGLLFSLPFFSLAAINSFVARGQGRGWVSGFIEVSLISATAFLLLIGYQLLWKGPDLASVSAIFFLAALLVFVLGEFSCGPRNSILSRGEPIVQGAFANGLRFALSPLVVYLTQWLVLIFLGSGPPGEVSQYSVGVRVASAAAFAAITIDAFVAPIFARLYKEGRFCEISNLIRRVRLYSISSMGSVVFIYAFFGEKVFIDFLGGEYASAFRVSVIISLGYLVMMAVGPYQYLLLMCGQASKVNYANVSALVVVFLLSLFAFFLDINNAILYSIFVLFGRVLSVFMMRFYGLRALRVKL